MKGKGEGEGIFARPGSRKVDPKEKERIQALSVAAIVFKRRENNTYVDRVP